MPAQPDQVTATPSSERAQRMLDAAKRESLVAREQRRFARQMRAHAALLLRGAHASNGQPRDQA